MAIVTKGYMVEEISNNDLHDIIGLIKAQYGYDFANYSEASLKRRFVRFLNQEDITVYDLKFSIVNDKPFFFWLLECLTVNVTEMFRDPLFYKALREQVFPVLSTYPVIKIWHAGCSSGEEAFSMAIMLKEAGLLERTRIYATDINMANIEKATSGIVPLATMKSNTFNYLKSGGAEDFSNYYTARYDNAIISRDIRKHIIFSQHNLANDYVFNEFQLICCRNVFIYFNKVLQDHVMELFCHSLSSLGFLAMGQKETLMFSDSKHRFEDVNGQYKIYRLKE